MDVAETKTERNERNERNERKRGNETGSITPLDEAYHGH